MKTCCAPTSHGERCCYYAFSGDIACVFHERTQLGYVTGYQDRVWSETEGKVVKVEIPLTHTKVKPVELRSNEGWLPLV